MNNKWSMKTCFFREFSGEKSLQNLEGKIKGKLYQGRSRRMWIDGMNKWSLREKYTDINRKAENKSMDLQGMLTF